jgi:molybdopterin-guanine dinucleotide biosynthesis protein A
MNQPVPWVATALLAGGQSRRMGRPKPLLPVPHQTLLAGHVDSAASLHRPVLLCSDRLDYRAVVTHPCVHIHDHISQAGPLAALAGARNLVTADPALPAPKIPMASPCRSRLNHLAT